MVTESRYRRYFVPDRMMPGFVLSFIRVSHKRIQKIKVNVVNIRITFQESIQVIMKRVWRGDLSLSLLSFCFFIKFFDALFPFLASFFLLPPLCAFPSGPLYNFYQDEWPENQCLVTLCRTEVYSLRLPLKIWRGKKKKKNKTIELGKSFLEEKSVYFYSCRAGKNENSNW